MGNVTLIPYDVSGVLNATDGENMFVKMIRYVSNPDPSTVSWLDYTPGLLVLLTVFFIIFMSLTARGANFLGAYFGAMIGVVLMAVFFYPLQIISGFMLVLILILFLSSIAGVWFFSR